ncbi:MULTISPECIES: BlaI/MecI/CopY family transcriptional regulator [unclassified Curtobacterium]|jgi:predicted transcriptional regulator|uniref:BlaI/MecI/CopY family transcriptional regulator n=1 Tax=unclassified Curtobacterium TaxID=257496 RepID=UPI00089DF03D|nr:MULTISPECIES: BlaI/MecI/CopY family transcriptional regulator [unclassified Curtobacterium]AOX64958.1 transcriptional regulator [Curtobacterium sp. BH-2-1-1]MCC8906904.1 BlaI/MecI/CopY family transcriptional regulator [Curtobacterium sp. GD1]MCT9620944.1 BlaI/MecI/CopY family transcriptional regulator [Curtobacterium sp. C2H10]MDR6170740.1 putative transcriptional regulator [Curtobacterium sp. SORGH_AS_0776]OII26147.1 transcriptional regulator [Curtobacterium sp. MCBA15_013]
MAGQRSRPRGQLEQAVLDALWSADGGLSARQVLDAFPEPRPALTTVLTVLDRLGRKGRVERQQHDDAPLTFRATNSREEQTASLMSNALAAATDREAALLQFTGSLASDDLDVIRRALDARARS